MRKAKIVATLGPSSNTVEKIKELILSGLNVCRVNMSHGTHENHAELIANIRKASREINREVAILADLQGPKIRTDKLPENLKLENGQIWVIGQTKHKEDYPEYKDCYIPTIYDKLVDDCHDGARILFDDGKLVAKAIERDRDVYKIEVLVGGELKSNKGINLPDCDVSAPAFTEKDREDLMFALKHDIDFVALSFVRRQEDVQQVKTLLHSLKVNIPIISKIEKPQAIDNLDEIIKVTDAIMVARGDMGVEVGNHLVPSLQKLIITKCNEAKIPVITATQMLESMTDSPTPTRAEASDVANAIWDGTDAVMLSGETASGLYPVETVKMMADIIIEAEKTPKERPFLRHLNLKSVNSSLMVAASMIAEKVEAKRIIALTEGGNSCLKISMHRPFTPVAGVTNSYKTGRRLCLYWGVYPLIIEDDAMEDDEKQLDVLKYIKGRIKLFNGDKVVITRGDGKYFRNGLSNSVQVEVIKDGDKVPGSSEGLEEGSDEKKRILHDLDVCAICQNCVSICPHDIWEADEKTKEVKLVKENVSKCTMDMECIRVCPTGAIEIIPKFE
ncbi:pyruvate kinase [Halobacteriovorax sp. GB3]|uniref:pyruvate kinase n=1 Tax=Halobacteriovorax sp. GB3 TaxID=2719615 RepID=UPI0023621DA4|nr:pyruvate kinase [Halobacteriovorax sp. GB3]MDD0853652.1 pyruvate kinase [Halobacteriovorax sp. GB3]